jgi:hypothetical protein
MANPVSRVRNSITDSSGRGFSRAEMRVKKLASSRRLGDPMAKPSTASSKFHDQLVPASPPSAAVSRRFPAFTRDENPGVADSPVPRTHVRQPPRGPGDSVLVVHEAGAARHGRTGGIVPPVIDAVLRGTSTPHVPPTSPPAALLRIAHYGNAISCSGAVFSAGNAGGDTGATAEAVTVMCSCQ